MGLSNTCTLKVERDGTVEHLYIKRGERWDSWIQLDINKRISLLWRSISRVKSSRITYIKSTYFKHINRLTAYPPSKIFSFVECGFKWGHMVCIIEPLLNIYSINHIYTGWMMAGIINVTDITSMKISLCNTSVDVFYTNL